jgi:glycosyltransferase involved in cell wall biosynthesis
MLREIEEAQLINVPSKFVWNSFVQNGVPEKKLVLNNYGVDAGRFYPSEQKDAMFTIVYVGSVELRKGVHYLVQAFDKLKLRNAQIKVIGHLKEDFVGSFPGYLKYEHVKWLGHCSPDQTAEVMRRSHVLVMPSVMEGQSLTILEGQACGLPVIASENTGGADIIKNGYNGYLFPNRDVEQLSQYILRLYKDTDLVRTMGLNASQVFAQNFTADLYGQRIINLLCRFLN